jgi:hypothetical protein
MGQGVVITTEQTEIVDLCLTVIRPGDEVVNIAPARRAGTTRPGAVPIPGNHRPPQGSGNDPGLSSHIEYFRASAKDDAGNRAVTEQDAQGVFADDNSALGLVKAPEPVAQGIQVDVDVEVGAFTADGW